MKRILNGLLIVCILVCLSGCGNTPMDVDFGSLLSDLEASAQFPEMVRIGKDQLDYYFDIAPDTVQEMIVKISADNMRAEEIFIVRAVSAAKAKDIASEMETHLKSQKNSFQNYNPEEYEKMKDTTVQIRGTYVFYAIGSSPAELDQVFEKYF